jgi:hypothetical protein
MICKNRYCDRYVSTGRGVEKESYCKACQRINTDSYRRGYGVARFKYLEIIKRLKNKILCPVCKHEMIFEDESFDHAFGTEIRKYYYCERCDYQTRWL